MCTAIVFVGMIINMIREGPQFYSLAAAGGALWCTGNMLCVPIIARLGMGVGLSLWGGSSMVFGWISAVTGMMGQPNSRDTIKNWYLNVIGMLMTIVAMVLLLNVKSETSAVSAAALLNEESRSDEHDAVHHPVRSVKALNGDGTPRLGASAVAGSAPSVVSLTDNSPPSASSSSGSSDSGEHAGERHVAIHLLDESTTQRRVSIDAGSAGAPSARKRVEGIVMALVAGFLFGVNYNLVEIVKDQHPHASKNGLDFTFSHFVGIYVASTTYFMAYAGSQQFYFKRLPQVPTDITFPGFVSGVLWAIAQSGWFVANDDLGQLVTWPILSVGPPIIAYCWSIFYLGEIKGARNFKFLGAFFLLSVISITLVMLSRK